MKRFISILSIVLITLTITSCFSKNENKETKNEKTAVDIFGYSSFTDNSMIYINNRILHFLDTNSKQDTVVCNKPQCKHLYPSREELETNSINCDGYVGDSYGFVIYNDYLYYISNTDSILTKEFYRCNKDGSNKKLLATIENVPELIYFYLQDDHMFISYREDCDEHGKELDKTETGIINLDLKEEKAEKIPLKNDYSSIVSNIHYYNNKIYFSYNYSTKKIEEEELPDIESPDYEPAILKFMKNEIDCYDPKTKKVNKILDLKKHSEIFFGENYFAICDRDGTIKYLNLDDNEIKTIDGKYKDCSVIFYDNNLMIIDYKNLNMKKYSIKDKKIIENIKMEDNNFSVPPCFTDNYAYYLCHDSDDEYYDGRISKEDFFKGKTKKVELLNKASY